MMVLGTIAAFGFEDFPPREVIGLYAGVGCTVAQAYRNRDKDISADEILAVCNDVPIRIESLHAHFGDDLDPASEDEQTRRRTVESYRPEAEFCRKLGGGMIVVHPSPANAPVGNIDRRYAQLRRSMDDFAAIGEQTGIRIAIENTPPYHPVGPDVQRIVDAVAATGSDHVRFLLDFGHAHMACGITEGLRAANDRLAYTHVHDNDGANDIHALPYHGDLPWDLCREELHKTGFDGVFMLEAFTSADDLRRMLDDEWKRKIQAFLDNGH